ncbi:hypothetical protein BN946_scf184778.g2 [Trametes cinnabarina]|uniref:Uncharacterized protein n=1 Tax=Pycnoporus cinnabarinus TaxID=5643 RepID=A0A060SBE1_PYCCI|nr:hypothetical protein BN946_scf184778.g2 [Trametes cinnabarina]
MTKPLTRATIAAARRGYVMAERITVTPPTPSLPLTPTTPLTPTATETRRKRLAKLKRTLGDNVPIDLVLPLRAPKHASATPSPTTPSAAAKSSPLSTPRAPQSSRRRSMSLDFQHTEPPSQRRSSRVWVTGNGSWTGEWNRKDIREVQQQLRALRAR